MAAVKAGEDTAAGCREVSWTSPEEGMDWSQLEPARRVWLEDVGRDHRAASIPGGPGAWSWICPAGVKPAFLASEG